MFFFVEVILKKIFILAILLFPACYCFGAKFTDLMDADTGILLYRKRDCKVFVFNKTCDGKLWECAVFRENKIERLNPAECEVLELDEDTITPHDVVINYVYYSCPGRNIRNSMKAAVFRNLAKKINSSDTKKVLDFYYKLNSLKSSISDSVDNVILYKRKSVLLIRSKKNSSNYIIPKKKIMEDDDYETKIELELEKLLLTLEKNSCLQIIEDFISSKDDSFIATALYLRYFSMVKAQISSLPSINREFYTNSSKELLELSKDILAKYHALRKKNKKREGDFRALCPDVHGTWEYVGALNLKELQNSLRNCFISYQKLGTYSSYTEFPKWGNAALEVLQMINFPDLERKFDMALQTYQKRLKP